MVKNKTARVYIELYQRKYIHTKCESICVSLPQQVCGCYYHRMCSLAIVGWINCKLERTCIVGQMLQHCTCYCI